MSTHHNPGPMDAPPGLLTGEFPVPESHPLYCARCGFVHPRPSGTGCMGVEVSGVTHPVFGHDMNPITTLVQVAPEQPLTPEEARVAALCLRSALVDYAKLDMACPLHVWLDEKKTPGRRQLDEEATEARKLAALRALAKLERSEVRTVVDVVTDKYSGALRELAR